MKLAIIIINLIVTILIAIGDFVLFYIRIFFLLITKITLLFLRILALIKKSILTFLKTFKNKLIFSIKKADTKSKLAAFRMYLSFKSFKRKLAYKKKRFKKRQSEQKKQIKKHEIAIFPTPHYFKLKIKFFFVGFLFCVIFILIPLGTYAFLNNLPNPKLLSSRDIPQTSKIYDRNGKLLYQIYANENRTLIPLSSIPKNLINATIAIEDKDFYKNPGIDLNGIARAAIADLSGKPIQGGSTITQQLIKSTLLTPEVSINRKIKELALALWAERIYSKNQILEMYFNQVPYGGTAWGVEAASETYFGKNVKNLDLAQCAFLAGMPQAPSSYSPYGENPNLWKKRQKDVLNKMYQLKYITKNERDNALSENLTFETPQIPIHAPHFVMYAKDYLVRKYGLPLVEKGGLNVITTLDLSLQNNVSDIVKLEVENDAYLNLTNGAALVTDPNSGDILAMVGSKDYNDPNSGNVNLTTALRQPGSSIKLVTYTAALINGFTAASIMDDSPVTYNAPGAPSYSPVNYDGAFHGKVPLRLAFANSFNIPAVKTLAKIGIPTMIEQAKKMGITTWGNSDQYGLSLTLGAAEVKMVDMATVFGTIANQGKKVDLDPLLKVTDYQGNIIYQKHDKLPQQIVDPGVAYIISNILADNKSRSLEFGANSPLNIPGHFVSVKTGTTDNKRDNWTIGFTPSYLVAVWVGNNDNTPMSQALASGITGAAPIWNKIMISLLPKNASSAPPSIPDNVIQKKCSGKTEYFIKGSENDPGCLFRTTPSPSAVLKRN